MKPFCQNFEVLIQLGDFVNPTLAQKGTQLISHAVMRIERRKANLKRTLRFGICL